MATLLAAILLPNFMRARARGQNSACKSNLKNIGTALEMYSHDNGGRFPPTLKALTPMSVPTCPSAGWETYSATYVAVNDGKKSAYTLVCAGAFHGGVGYSPNYPQYTSTQGLLER